MNRKTAAIVGIVVLGIAVIFFVTRGGKSTKKDQVTKTKGKTKVVKRRAQQAKGLQDDQSQQTQVLQDDDPAGTMRLEGLVLGPHNQPVAGAEVIVSSTPQRKTKSGKDGSFFFEKLMAKRYRLVAKSKEGVAGPVTARLNDKSDPVTLRLRPAAKIEVTVVTGLDEKVSGATVELRGLFGEQQQTGSDGIATFEGVPSGRYQLVANATGYAKSFNRVWLGSGAGLHRRRVSLIKGAPVSGVVVSKSGAPVKEAMVTYRAASRWGRGANARLDGVTTDKDGKFTFKAMPPGSFRFVARHSTYAPGSSDLIVLDGATSRDNVQIKVDQGGAISGVVIDAGGEAVPWARVRVGRVGRGRWGRTRQASTDEQGKFEITGLVREASNIIALHDTANSAMTEVDLEKQQTVKNMTLSLKVDGVIAGTVVDSEGEPIEGAQVTAFPKTEGRMGMRKAFRSMRMRGMARELTDAGGRFELRGLEPGKYTVDATRAGSAAGGFWGRMRRRFRGGRGGSAGPDDTGKIANTGDKTVKITLQANGGVKGKISFSTGGGNPTIYTVGVSRRARTPFTNKDGSFELGDLPPGEYTLRITGPDFNQKRVDQIKISPNKITNAGTIQVDKGRSVSGKVTTSDGKPVPGATVMAGRFLMGDGSSTRARRGAKQNTTDENGEFHIRGLSGQDVSVVAEHPTLGRTPPYKLPAGDQSAKGIQLQLQTPAALEGTIFDSTDKPVKSAMVMARSTTNSASVSVVRAGADGKYRFDKLAEGSYTIIAGTDRRTMFRSMRNGGKDGPKGKEVAMKAGETQTLNIKLPPPEEDMPF